MSHSIPPNSSSPQGSSRNDEWIAVLVALVAMSGIFFWILGRDAKPNKQKFASPTVVPAPQTTISDNLNLSRVLEESFAQYRSQTPVSSEPVSVSPTASVFNRFSTADVTGTDSNSTAMNPVLGFNPFFFAPQDQYTAESPEPTSEVTLSPLPTQDSTVVTQPETEAAATPETEATTQPETEATTQPETEAATQPETETATQPETETPTPVPLVLTDVPEGFWAREFIDYTTQEDIIIPYANGTFKPDQPITRAEFAAQVENAFIPEENQSGGPSYKDVDQSYWAEQAIVDVTKTGFMTGYPGEVFNPNLTVPRVQVLVALVSGLNLKIPKNPEEILKVYQDADQIPQWAVEQIAAATEAGLVVNYPETKTLNPNQPATRAEVSAMIYQALVASDKAEPISSDYIVKPDKGGILPF
ncbi:MAG: S-layer homology domain-containing protein [Limnoraphis sp.]